MNSFDPDPLRDPSAGSTEGRRSPPALFWVGLAFFALPFVAVPMALLGVLVPPAGMLGMSLGLVPCALILAFLGMAMMIFAYARASSRRAPAPLVGRDRPQMHGRPEGRWSMRGDHPSEIHVEDEVGGTTGDPETQRSHDREERPCDHCGIISDAAGPTCPRCGAPR